MGSGEEDGAKKGDAEENGQSHPVPFIQPEEEGHGHAQGQKGQGGDQRTLPGEPQNQEQQDLGYVVNEKTSQLTPEAFFTAKNVQGKQGHEESQQQDQDPGYPYQPVLFHLFLPKGMDADIIIRSGGRTRFF